MKLLKKIIEFLVSIFIKEKEILFTPITEKPTTETEDPKKAEVIKETIESDKKGITAGASINLKQVALYSNSLTKYRAATISGLYFIWNEQTVNSRIRITNLAERVGVEGQVTGWINISAVMPENKEKTNTSPPTGLRNSLLSVAENEKGYSVGTYKVNKYTKWYTGTQNEYDWCGMFVVWCARNAGVDASIIPKSAYVPYFYDWYKAKGLIVNGTDLSIQGGDLIIFDWNANDLGDHIGIIEKTDGEYIYTVEGNTSPYAVTQRTIKRTDVRILAVAKPEF